MLERILVALDGSRLSEQSVPFATALAETFEAELILLRVVESPGRPSRSLDSFDWRLGRAEAIEYLAAIEERLRAEGIEVDVEVTSGRPCEEILEVAATRHADLIILGSHGGGGMSRFPISSTAQKVAFNTDVSVLVIPANEDELEGVPFTNVLVPVDGSPHSDWAVSVAARVAQVHSAHLTILHVVRTPTLLDPQGTVQEQQLVDEIVATNRRAAGRYLGSLKSRLESPQLPVRARIEVSGDIAPVLLRYARSGDPTLVLLSSRGRATFEEGPCGTLITVMLANAGSPLLVLREPKRSDQSTRRWRGASASVGQRRNRIPR